MKKALLILVLVLITVGAFAQIAQYGAVKDPITDVVTQGYVVVSQDVSGWLVIAHTEGEPNDARVGVLSKTGMLAVDGDVDVVFRIGKNKPIETMWKASPNKSGVVADAVIARGLMTAFEKGTDEWLIVRIIPKYTDTETYKFSITEIHNLLERHPFK